VFNEFCDRTTLHGLKYIGDKNLHFLERLFWSVAFILATMTAGYFIRIVYSKWDETPVIVSIGARTTSLTDIPFPAVTVCTVNKVRKTRADTINNCTNETYKLYKKFLKETCSSKSTNIQQHIEESTEWKMVQNFMVAVRQPCHEMIKVCYFAGELHTCSDIFNPSLTDEGICCSFNKVKRDLIFRNARNLTDLNVTFPTPTADWTPENGYPSNATADTLPWRAFGAGAHLGLTLVLDVEADEFYCSTSAGVGFKLLLHNPVEMPKIADFGSLIAPGREYRINVIPTINKATSSLRNVKEADRQCAYSEERYLRFYRTYTQKHCNLECEANFTFSVCRCVPFHLPKDVNTAICGKQEEGCAELARRFLEMMILDNDTSKSMTNWTKPNCHCLPGCNELSYSSSMTYGNIDPSFVTSKLYTNIKENFDEKKIRENLAVVHIFYTNTQFLSYYKTEMYGLTEFLSSTGGLLGLFIGFSFISAVEILYFSTVRFLYSFVRRRRNMVENYPFVK
jgi:amiloride-sensitive sodium channel